MTVDMYADSARMVPMDPTPGQQRTARARATRTAAKHKRWADGLREAGWTVTPPGPIGWPVRTPSSVWVVFDSDDVNPPGSVIATFATEAEAVAHLYGPGDGYAWSVFPVAIPTAPEAKP